MELVQATTLTSNANTISFSSIPQTGTDLILLTSLRATTDTSSEARITFNNVTSSIYYSAFIRDLPGTFGAGTFTFGYAYTHGTDSRVPAGYFSTGRMHIFDYAFSGYKKIAQFDGSTLDNFANPYQFLTNTVFDSTSAITSLQIKFGSGDILAGSSASLYTITRA